MKLTVTALVAAALCLGTSQVMARDIQPPFSESACETLIAKYVAKVGATQKSVIRVTAGVERDDKLYFRLDSAVSAELASLHFQEGDIPELPSIDDPKIVNAFQYPHNNRGVWMVLTPGPTSMNAQVFAEYKPGACKALLKPVLSFDGGRMMKYLLAS